MTSDERRELIDYLRVAASDHHEGVYVLVSVKECRELLAMLDEAKLVIDDYFKAYHGDSFYMDAAAISVAQRLDISLGDN